MVETVEKVDAGEHVRSVLSLHAERDSLLGTKGNIDGLIRMPQFIQADVLARLDAAFAVGLSQREVATLIKLLERLRSCLMDDSTADEPPPDAAVVPAVIRARGIIGVSTLFPLPKSQRYVILFKAG